MVIKMKFESKWGQREVKIKVRENSLSELLTKPSKMEWLLDELMRKSERVTEIEVREE